MRRYKPSEASFCCPAVGSSKETLHGPPVFEDWPEITNDLPFRHPTMPGLSVAGFRLVNTPDHTWGFPCCIGLPLVCMLSPLPRWNCKVQPSFSSLAVAAFPKFLVSRLPHHVFRGLLSVHSRYGLHTRQVTYMTLCTGGFSRFVACTTAPIATGWNESCRAGFAPAERPCLCTAHKKYYVIRSVCGSD